MITMIKNPVELFIFINILSLFTPPDRKVEQKFKKNVKEGLMNIYLDDQDVFVKDITTSKSFSLIFKLGFYLNRINIYFIEYHNFF